MKILRDLSGDDLATNLYQRWKYAKVNQVGSHIILETEEPLFHRVSVPNHQTLRIGTLNTIVRFVTNDKE